MQKNNTGSLCRLFQQGPACFLSVTAESRTPDPCPTAPVPLGPILADHRQRPAPCLPT